MLPDPVHRREVVHCGAVIQPPKRQDLGFIGSGCQRKGALRFAEGISHSGHGLGRRDLHRQDGADFRRSGRECELPELPGRHIEEARASLEPVSLRRKQLGLPARQSARPQGQDRSAVVQGQLLQHDQLPGMAAVLAEFEPHELFRLVSAWAEGL